MEEAKDFVEGLSEETGRSLGETFRLFNANTDWQSVLVSGLTKLIVSILILIIFWVAYLALSRGLKALLQRFKATRERNFERPVKLGLRYTVLVLAFLALTIQYGIPPQFTSAIARTAIIVFSFYIHRSNTEIHTKLL